MSVERWVVQRKADKKFWAGHETQPLSDGWVSDVNDALLYAYKHEPHVNSKSKYERVVAVSVTIKPLSSRGRSA